MLKLHLSLRIYTILRCSGLKQVQIAKAFGAQQPQVSLLMRNRAGGSDLEAHAFGLLQIGSDLKQIASLCAGIEAIWQVCLTADDHHLSAPRLQSFDESRKRFEFGVPSQCLRLARSAAATPTAVLVSDPCPSRRAPGCTNH